ncbi:Uncharacterized protein dnl_57550 [Desulfonema limicola]|uniref:Prevent-host-death protein n=1 Tax=Desulfonema limicola TaxID=45656 RepID=A0A975GK12_9BACT|nr:hypothetical protein [Desulfonema limicola]QTA83353.1 Uncharacterized protein dnl_57550 [Desulfonema limicola]
MKILTIDNNNINIIAVLEEMEKNRENIVIYRNGKPLADLTLHVKKDRITPHPAMKEIKIKYDPAEPLEQPPCKEALLR